MQTFKQFYRWLRKKDKSYREQFIELVFVLIPAVVLIRSVGFGLYQVPTGSMEKTMLVGDRFFADKFTILFRDIKRGDIISFNDPMYTYSENPYVRFYENFLSFKVINWTKRVIGIPGDHVKGVLEDGKPVVYLNGERLNEPYLNPYPLIPIFNQANKERPFAYKTYDPSKSFDEQPYYYMTAQQVKDGQKIAEHYYGGEELKQPNTPTVDMRDGSAEVIDVFDVQLGKDEYWVMGDNRRGSFDSRNWGKLQKSLIHGKIVFRLYSIDGDESWWIFDLIKHPIDFWKRVRWSRFLQPVR